MIREATFDDLEQVMPLFRKAHARSMFNDTPMDELHIQRMFAVGVAMPNFFCRVVEHEGSVVGILGGGIDKNVWGTPVAVDLIFYSTRDSHILIRQFVEWARGKGAKVVNFTDLNNNPRLQRLFEIQGMGPKGSNYGKVI